MVYTAIRSGFFVSIIGFLLALGLGFFVGMWGFENMSNPDESPMNSLAILFGFIVLLAGLFWPMVLAFDVSDDIQAIKELKKNNKRYKDFSIRHPKFGTITLLTLLSPFTFGILWVVAFFMATGNTNVTVGDDIGKAAEEKDWDRNG